MGAWEKMEQNKSTKHQQRCNDRVRSQRLWLRITNQPSRARQGPGGARVRLAGTEREAQLTQSCSLYTARSIRPRSRLQPLLHSHKFKFILIVETFNRHEPNYPSLPTPTMFQCFPIRQTHLGRSHIQPLTSCCCGPAEEP